MLFFIYVFHLQLSELFAKRLLLSVSFGLLFTHILRFIILKFKLLPPIFGKQWIHLFSITLLICIAYSFINSMVVEWLKWYDGNLRATIPERFFS